MFRSSRWKSASIISLLSCVVLGFGLGPAAAEPQPPYPTGCYRVDYSTYLHLTQNVAYGKNSGAITHDPAHPGVDYYWECDFFTSEEYARQQWERGFAGLNVGAGFTGIDGHNNVVEFPNGSKVQSNQFAPQSTNGFLNVQGTFLFPVTTLPIPQIGSPAGSSMPILFGPYGSLYQGQQSVSQQLGNSFLGTTTNTIFVGGGEIAVQVMSNAIVYGKGGFAEARETNFVIFAPGQTSATVWVPGFEWGGGVRVADVNHPGIFIFAEVLHQQYRTQSLPGGIASPGFNYNFTRSDNKATLGVSFNATDFWARGINFGTQLRH